MIFLTIKVSENGVGRVGIPKPWKRAETWHDRRQMDGLGSAPTSQRVCWPPAAPAALNAFRCDQSLVESP